MIRQYLPVRDASVYSQHPDRNTGMDEILEVGKTEYGNYPIRSIIDFDFTGILSQSANNAVYILRLQVANVARLAANQTLVVGAYTGSWSEGTGYFYQDMYQIPNGVTWTNVSGNYLHTESVVLKRPVENEVQVDVTHLITQVDHGHGNHLIPVTGLILQFPNSDESNPQNKGIVKFFSRDTHTIYSPILEVRHQDQIYSTGTLAPAQGKNIVVLPQTLAAAYRQGETARVAVTVREKYPMKTFTNSFNPYASVLYVPETTYFSVIDEQTNHPVIPFSEFTRLHQTDTETYFSFEIKNMYPRRFYKVVIKMVFNDGTQQIFDGNYVFKVVD